MLGRTRVVPLLFLLLAVVAPVQAQTPSGEISGTIVDSSGLPVPGVTVTVTNKATNVARAVQTNETGLYVISAIPPGTYDLKAELAGFRTVGWIVAFGAVVSMSAVLLVFQYGQPRIFFAMGRDGLLPRWASKRRFQAVDETILS